MLPISPNSIFFFCLNTFSIPVFSIQKHCLTAISLRESMTSAPTGQDEYFNFLPEYSYACGSCSKINLICGILLRELQSLCRLQIKFIAFKSAEKDLPQRSRL